MEIQIRPFQKNDIPEMNRIWNQVVEAGAAFPQLDELNDQTGKEFFESQSLSAVAVDPASGNITGLYILHPNNVGRCGHICNASFAVDPDQRGYHIGEALVKDCLIRAEELGFRILQFNAVVADNIPALNLYKKLGFTQLGVIPGGFRKKNGTFADIIPHYIVLQHN